MKPCLVMKAALDKQDRDFIYNLCQYGMGNVWEWGAEVGGHCWPGTTTCRFETKVPRHGAVLVRLFPVK